MGDIACLIAPRPLLIQSCWEDRQNGPRGLDNVLGQVEIVRRAYRLLDVEDRLSLEICEGGHRFHSEHLTEELKTLTKYSGG